MSGSDPVMPSGEEGRVPEIAMGGPTEGPAAPEDPGPPAADGDEEVIRRMRRQTRRSFLLGGLATMTGVAGWRWLASRRPDNGIPWPLRRGLEVNEQLSRDYFKGSRLAPTFPKSMARKPRVNGTMGMSDMISDPASWRLRVEGLADASEFPAVAADAGEGGGDGEAVLLTMEDIRALPRVEMVTELKCIEGWSEVVHWGGARFADFIARYMPATRSGYPPDVDHNHEDLSEFVALDTMDGEYYVGLDMASALHPQTLLCYEMNGALIPPEHGAPLRLVTPVKYGIKNIKRIGTIRFTNTRPADYWAERGYDWYAGH